MTLGAHTYTRLGDETPWTNESDHGSAAERVSAFNRGAARNYRLPARPTRRRGLPD
ncbi:hypothetical protein GCM10022419_135960 [Nonomuraea rosea]|uniref:Uncharacterized protein n=1 Tax=Nonomuraea rosea TaxID=638574 RepID=A0ABP7A922_9ACTN